MHSDQIVIDLSYFYSVTGGDKDFEQLLLSGTVTDIEDKITALDKCWDRNDASGVRKNAHALISLAAIAGMPQVEVWSRKIDNAFTDEIFHPELVLVVNNIICGWPGALLKLKQIMATG